MSLTRFRRWSLLAAISALLVGGAALLPTAAHGQRPVLLEEGQLDDSDRRRPDNNSPFDIYSFSGLAGQTVVITLESSAFDTHLFLLDQDGNALYENDDAVEGHTTNSLLRVILPRDGRYNIAVNALNGTGRGAYLVSVTDVTPASVASAASTPNVALSAQAAGPVAAAPPVYSALQSFGPACDVATNQLMSTVTDGRRIDFPLHNAGIFAGEAPAGRSGVFTFGMSGPDVKFVLESPQYVVILTKIFLEDCPSAGAVILGNIASGDRLAVGLVGDQVTRFQCAESLGILPSANPVDQKMPWGYYFCSL
ncbi:MAG: PPC domain-containing protein [Cyanobacteria bacterium P01_F01_bin.53]